MSVDTNVRLYMIPDWIILVSYAGVIVSPMSVGIKIGGILPKLDYVIGEVDKLKQDVKTMIDALLFLKQEYQVQTRQPHRLNYLPAA